MRPASRFIAICLALFLVGFWLGEDVIFFPALRARTGFWLGGLVGGAGFTLGYLLPGLLLLAALAWVVTRVSRAQSKKWLVGGAAAVVAASGWLLGAHLAMRAFNDCVSRGDEVRAALLAYQKQQGRYPSRLEELSLVSLSGRRILWPNLLHFRRTDTGFQLQFQDWLVKHTATDAEPFLAVQ